jgi:hypothetical protein
MPYLLAAVVSLDAADWGWNPTEVDEKLFPRNGPKGYSKRRIPIRFYQEMFNTPDFILQAFVAA